MKTLIIAASSLVALTSGAGYAAPAKIELVTPRAKVGAASLALTVAALTPGSKTPFTTKFAVAARP